MCLVTQERIYYEQIEGTYYLCDAGNVFEFSTKGELETFVNEFNPHAEIIEVNEGNWQSFYDQGAFHA
jgi:hypothetical protein